MPVRRKSIFIALKMFTSEDEETELAPGDLLIFAQDHGSVGEMCITRNGKALLSDVVGRDKKYPFQLLFSSSLPIEHLARFMQEFLALTGFCIMGKEVSDTKIVLEIQNIKPNHKS